MASGSAGKPTELDTQSLRDSFIPTFDGTTAGYREWRKRIVIYAKKMELSKRTQEAVLNLLGSLQGTAWRVMEDYDLNKANDPQAFDKILSQLDAVFQYDDKVEMPADFTAYFDSAGRRPGQTLLQFVTEHDEKLRRLEKHKVQLPAEVQGWYLLNRAMLSREQRQMVMTQANSLKRNKIQEAMFAILGQDYKSSHGPLSSATRWGKPSGKGRGYCADDEPVEASAYDEWYDYDEEEYGYYEYDEGDADFPEGDFDHDAAYYEAEGAADPINDFEFDVAEYDSCYATYVDARKRFNDLRMARGFLPVVALDPSVNAAGSQQPQAPANPKGKGKKGKSKGKGKNTFRAPRPPMKAADPRGRAQAAMNAPCLRCGSGSHRTSQCTQGAKSSPKAAPAGANKRQAVEGMAVSADPSTAESGMVMFEDSTGAQRPDCAMMDPGASSFLTGLGPLMRYLEHLSKLGFDISTINFKKADRVFHFGGDHQAKSCWTVHLPVFMNNKYGLIQAFVLRGETPMLVGRPIAKALGLSVDFLNDRLRFHDGEWRAATLGRHLEYLLPLTEDYDPSIAAEPEFDLVLEDEKGPNYSFDEFKAAEEIYVVTEDTSPEGSNILKNKQLKSLDNAVLTQLNAMEAYISQTLRDMDLRQPRQLWEVYSGESRMTQIASSLGLDAQHFGLNNGWNFSYKSHQREFMKLLDEFQPEEVYLSPTCGPWSPMQNISATTPKRREQLEQLRDWHHRVHLRFCRRIYLKQISEGRHAHIEQPTPAMSWRTKAFSNLPGFRAKFSQCQYGSVCKDDNDVWLPVRKDTTLLTSKQAVAQVMNRVCPGDHEHCRLEGSLRGFQAHRTSYMENYQPALASTLAAAMATPEVPHHWEFGFAVQEITEHVGKLADLQVEGKTAALRVVQKLHRNLGHPSTSSLVELLSSRGASSDVLQVAGSYVCAACQRYKRPNQTAPASLSKSDRFNQRLQADVFWIKVEDVKYPVLSCVDSATKYQSATLIPNEQTSALIAGLERCWIAHFGAPESLLTDEGRGWLSDQFLHWSDELSIQHEVAPGEAHTRLSLVERRHAVLRRAIEIYMTDLSLTGADGIRSALTYVVPQQNAQPSVSGYSPSQWLLGYQPQVNGLLISDQITPVHLAGGSSFEDALRRRNAAKTALLQADTDQRLRRALLRRYAGDNIRLSVGQTCFYWRDAQQADLVKIRWRGPAKVLMVQNDEQGNASVYWICHKTQLLRCAPHHVRPDFRTICKNVVDNLQEAKDVLRDAKSRGVTRFLDLNKLNRQHIDDINEDEEMISDDEADDYIPEAKRRRLAELAEADDNFEYEPSILGDNDALPTIAEDQEVHHPSPPADLQDQRQGPEPDPLQAHPETIADQLGPLADLVRTDLEEISSRDAEEPSAEVFPPTPMAASSAQPPVLPELDPATSARFQVPQQETFEQQRLRVDRQETLSFGPNRTHHGGNLSSPYARPPQEDAGELADMAFHVEDVEQDVLPGDWTFKPETGYFELRDGAKVRDFWELKAGCLIRHHLHHRRTLFDPTGLRDLPVPLDKLDNIRVTVYFTTDGGAHSFTDDFRNSKHFAKDLRNQNFPALWSGVTIFQLNAEARKELSMYVANSNHVYNVQKAKKVAQDVKSQQLRQQRRAMAAKAKGEINEKNLTAAEKEQFFQAKVKELRSFFENGVWEFSTAEEATPERTLTSRMLLKWSRNADGSPRAKARLVVRGFNDVDALSGNLETASPTTSRLSRSILLSISANLRWRGWTADVSTAFLQGLPQERKLWLKLPTEALQILGCTANVRMFLRKPVYGQLDAPRRWYLEAVRRLTSLGWKQHYLDPCAFLLFDPDAKLVAMLCLHVDDMLAAGDPNSKTYVDAEAALRKAFDFRTFETDDKTLEYCGVKLDRKDHCWTVSQEAYLQKVKPVTIHKGRTAEDEMNEHDRSQLRALLGSLQWPAVQTSPHLQCSASLISGQQKTGKLRAVIEANQLLKFAKQNADVKLQYEPMNIDFLQDLRLCVMFDAAHGVREDSTSQGGYLMFLAPKEIFEKESTYHVIDWRSFKLPRVARSSLSAEAQAFGQAADMVEFVCIYWRCLFEPPKKLRDCLDQKSELLPTMITDAKALYDSYNKEGLTGSSSVDKRTSIEIRVGKEQLQSLGGHLKWMSSEKQFADGLTKSSTRSLLADRLRHHRQKLVWDPSYTSAKRKDAAAREASRTEFAKMKESNHLQPPHQPDNSTSNLLPNNHNNDDDVNHYETVDEGMHDETFEPADDDMLAEPFHPVEAYASVLQHAKTTVYAMVTLMMLPTTSAVHVNLDHEYGQVGIWNFVILTLLLLSVMFAVGYKVGIRLRQHRHQAELDLVYQQLDRNQQRHDLLQLDLERHRAMISDFREQLSLLSLDRAHFNTLSRDNQVMAIMMNYQNDVVMHLQDRVSRLLELIANHQGPCPLGDSILVQPDLDGSDWHIDAECPMLQLNRIHLVQEHYACEYCASRDTNMVTHPAFTGP